MLTRFHGKFLLKNVRMMHHEIWQCIQSLDNTHFVRINYSLPNGVLKRVLVIKRFTNSQNAAVFHFGATILSMPVLNGLLVILLFHLLT